MPDRHLDQRDEGIKIFDLDLEEQAKNLLHAKCVMVPDKLTTRCPHFSVGPARTGTRMTWIRHGLFLTRSNFPNRHGKTHQHAWESLLGRWEGAPWHAILTHQELRPCKVEAFTSNDFQPMCGTIHDALTDTRAMAWGSLSTTTFRAERATVEGTTIPRDPRNKPTLHCEATPAPQQNTFPRDKATGETLLIDSTTTAPWLQPC
ncbi:hypothetical protein Lal_00031676 [Lupinus albus]|nr:hypothetical protein Lal_00031676 [Lupinus albus]